MNIKETFKALEICRKLGVTANLISTHGEGKSSVVKQYAKQAGMNYTEFRTGQAADAGDLTGLPEFMVMDQYDSQGNKIGEYKVTNFVLPAWFPRLENTVVFFDEVNRGAKDILNGVFEAILDKSMKNIAMPNGCQIVAAMNPPTDDYAGTIDFDDKAFQDRFVHIKFAPTFGEFREYMNTKYSGSGFLEFLGENDKLLRSPKLQDFSLGFVIPSPRSWETAFKLEQIYDNGCVDKALFLELMMGIVGSEASLAAMNYKETHVGGIKGVDLLENFHTDAVKKKLDQVMNKGRTDIVGNALLDIGEEFKNRKGLSNQEAQNVIALSKALSKNPEQQYTLLQFVISNMSNCTGNCEGFEVDGDGRGLGHSKELVAVMQKTLKAREEAAKEMEKAKAKKSKNKEPETV